MHGTWQNVIGESWLQSPVLTVPAGGAILTFKQFYDDYGLGLTLSVRFSNDNGANWTTGYTIVSGGGNIGPETVTVPITLSGNVIIQWYMNGNHFQLDHWWVDDVCVVVPLAHDVETVSIDMAGIIQPGSIAPLATIGNNGTNTETFNVTMTITPGTYTSTKQVQNLAPLTTTQVTFDPWNATVGNYTITVCTQLASDLDPTNNCINNQPISVQVLRKVYAYVAYDPTAGLPEGPAWFYVQTPGTITSLAATTSGQFIGAGTWANGIWYGSEYYDATLTPNGGGWWTIDPTTGAMTLIADIDKGFAGITYDKVTGIMYGTNWNGTNDELYTIDPATGAATLLGTYSTQLMINLAADGSGFLYGIGLTDDQLYKITPSTPPVAVAVGPTGQAFNYAQDMEFDYDNNILYACGYTATGTLYTVDRTTGACTAIGNFQSGAEMTGFAIPYTAGYRVYGTVYYGTLDTKPQATQTTVTLTPGPTTVNTGTGGAYEITPVVNGNYELTGATTKPWGGLNSPDPTFAQRYILGLQVLTNLQKRAADVNLSGTIQSVDVTMLKRRLVGQTYTQWIRPTEYVWDGPFVPGWHGAAPSWTPILGLPVTVAGGDVLQPLRTLCSGDVNSSHTPLPNP